MKIFDDASGLISDTVSNMGDYINNWESQITQIVSPYTGTITGFANALLGAEHAEDFPSIGAINSSTDQPFSLEYPQGLSDLNSRHCGPRLVISAFEYSRPEHETLIRGAEAGAGAVDKDITGVKTDLKFVIRLPLPASISQGYVQRLSEEGDWLSNLIQQTDIGDGTIGGMWESLKGIGSESLDFLRASAGDSSVNYKLGTQGILGMIRSGSFKDGAINAMKQAGMTLGVSLNPMTSVAYESPNLQEFSFTWNLVPKNLQESIAIEKIITMLREFSTADTSMDSIKALINYPLSFNVGYMSADGRSIIGPLPSSDCFLESVDVVYNSHGRPTLIDGNKPAVYSLSLKFKQQKMLTRKDLQILRAYAGMPFEEGEYAAFSRKYDSDNNPISFGGN